MDEEVEPQNPVNPMGMIRNIAQKKFDPKMIAAIAFAIILIITALGLGFGMMRNDPGEPTVTSASASAGDTSNLYFPVGIDQDAAATCLQNYLKSNVPNSPFIKDVADVGKAFVTAGASNNVNPALMIAIAGAETSFATTGWAKNHPETHNYFGMTATEAQDHITITNSGGDVKIRKFASWEEAINFQAQYIREHYLDNAKTSIILIGAEYAPVGAANDPTGLNNQWIINVSKYMSEISGKCPVFAPATITKYNSISQIKMLYGSTEAEVKRHIVTTTFMGKSLEVNKVLVDPLKKAETEIKSTGANYPITSLSGFFWKTNANDSSKISLHSFGLAIDINPLDNPNGARPSDSDPRDSNKCTHKIPDNYVKALENNGFFWGAKFKSYCDAMHFQYGGNAY